MSSQKTTNLKLHKWVKSDPIKMAEFNENFQKLDAAVAAGAKIATGSYVGTGTYGSSNPCSLTFDFPPKLLIIFNDVGRMHYYSGSSSTDHFNQIYDLTALGTDKKYERISSDTDRYSWISSDGKIVYWYCTGSGNRAHQQCNKSGTTYRYMAIG